MQVIAFILAIAAAVGFLIDAVWHKSITAAALTALTTPWMVQLCVLGGTHITG